MRCFDKKQSNKRPNYTFQLHSVSLSQTFLLSKQNVVKINTEVIDSLITNVKAISDAFLFFMMTFSVNSVHIRNMKIAIDSTLDTRI